jgi:hypothetical protein
LDRKKEKEEKRVIKKFFWLSEEKSPINNFRSTAGHRKDG